MVLSPNKDKHELNLLAVLVPCYIYYHLNHCLAQENVLQPNQRLLLQNCSNFCSFLQHMPCSSGHNCTQSDHCKQMEKFEKCKQVCIHTMWQPQMKKEVEMIDPEEVCFQHSK